MMDKRPLWIWAFIVVLLTIKLSEGASCEDVGVCDLPKKIFIHWKPLASGWYYLDHLSSVYVRNTTYTNFTYEFVPKKWGWNVVRFQNHPTESKNTLKTLDQSFSSLIPDLKDRNRNRNRSHRNSTCLQDQDQEDPKLEIYRPDKCNCTIIKENRTIFTRLDKSENIEKCMGALKDYMDLLPPEYRVLLPNSGAKFTSFNQTAGDFGAANTTNFLPSKEWKPEFYISNDCKIIYYNEIYERWYADYNWSMYNPKHERIPFFWASDRFPCIENFHPCQSWNNFRRSNGKDDFRINQFKFKIEKNKWFNLRCIANEIDSKQ